MLCAIGAAGFFLIQYQARKDQAKEAVKSVLQSVAATATSSAHSSPAQRRLRGSAGASGGSLDNSSNSRGSSTQPQQQQQSSRSAVRDGAFVCFKDRTGQVAVIQPYGNGGSSQLTFTCASGSSIPLPEGAGALSHINSDAVFLVRHVGGNNYAFCSPGAEGRYLSASRDLAVPPVLDSRATRASPAAHWRVTGQGITNVAHPHKKLVCVIAEVKLVPLESIVAVESNMAAHNREMQGKVVAAESVSKALQSQLAQTAKHLTATTTEYDTQVQALQDQLVEACSFNSQLTALIDSKDAKLGKLQAAFSQMKTQYQGAERELSVAYSEVASLQQQLAERDDDVGHLQQRMCSETKQWNQLRGALQDSLQAKDEEIATLSMQVQRMEHALRAVEHTLYGMRKPRRLDRASLDAVSIHQLQAAVDNFAAVGEAAGCGCGAAGGVAAVGMMMVANDDMSTEEAEALRVLLEQQSGAEGGLDSAADMDNSHFLYDSDPCPSSEFLCEAGRELSLQDLDSCTSQHDQGGSGDVNSCSNTQQQQRQQQRTVAAAAAAGGGSGGVKHHCAHTSSSSSRVVRSSGASEGRHRYAGSDDASDCDEEDVGGAAGDAGAGATARGAHCGGARPAAAAAAHGEGEYDDECVMVCTSMDEVELQHHLGALKASASQLTATSSGGGGAAARGGSSNMSRRSSSHMQQQQRYNSRSLGSSSGNSRKHQQQTSQSVPHAGPLHSGIMSMQRSYSGGAGSGSGGGSGLYASASLTQLSPVKEEAHQQQHHQQQHQHRHSANR